MHTKRSYIVLCLLLVSGFGWSQTPVLLKRALSAYNKMAYDQAVDLYENFIDQEVGLLTKGMSTYKDTLKLKQYKQAKLQLGDCYLQMRAYEDAARWYEKGFAKDHIDIEYNKQYYYNYGKSLHALGKYKEAKKHFELFRRFDMNDHTADKLISGLEEIEKIQSIESEYKIGELEFNTPGADFAPAFYKDGIIFSSDRGKEYPLQHTYGWDGSSFLDFFYVKAGDTTSHFFDKSLNSKFHEAGLCFNKRQDMVFFTRNNLQGMFAGKNEDGITTLKLYTARLKDGKWTEITEFPYNSPTYSIGEPSLSPDGETLFFVSDMPGGFGGTDIYMVKRDGKEWGEVTNLGEKINTPGEERSPFVTSDGDLYFASDGLGGLGGLDVYHANHAGGETKTDHNLSDVHMALLGLDFVASHEDHYDEVTNLGAPINSVGDDFGLIIDAKRKEGYFASNRPEGLGGDDIYVFNTTGAFNGVVSEEAQAKRAELKKRDDNWEKMEQEAANKKREEKLAEARKKAEAEFVTKVKGGNVTLAGQTLVKNKGAKNTEAVPVGEVNITIFKGIDIVKELTTDGEGKFMVTLPLGAKYDILAHKENLLDAEMTVDYVDKSGIDTRPTRLVLQKKAN